MLAVAEGLPGGHVGGYTTAIVGRQVVEAVGGWAGVYLTDAHHLVS